jgi:hypothetical protein
VYRSFCKVRFAPLAGMFAGRRLPTSSTALDLIDIKAGNFKTISPAPALAYSTPVAVQTTGTMATLPEQFLIFWCRSMIYRDFIACSRQSLRDLCSLPLTHQ